MRYKVQLANTDVIQALTRRVAALEARAAPLAVTSVVINGDDHLIVNYNDGSNYDAGSVGGGGVGPTLTALTLSGPVRVGTVSTGTIAGATNGSAIASNVTGLTVNSGARSYAFDGTGSAQTVANGLVETLAGAVGSPKSSAVTVLAATVTLNALTLSGSLTIGTATSGTINGATNGSTIAGSIPGITVNSGARTYSGTPTGSAQTIANGLVETLAGATNSPRSSAVTVASALTGFALNGSPNTAMKAMLARVAGGTGRGKIVFKGDSTTMGQGGGMTTGTSSDPLVQGASAALYRPSAAMASQLASNGYPAIDMGFVGPSGTGSTTEWNNYDPRTSFEGTPRDLIFNQPVAGGGFFRGAGGNTEVIDFAPTTACNEYEAVFYNVGATVLLAVGSSTAFTSLTAPGATVSNNSVTIPGTNSGFTVVRITMPTATTDPLRVVNSSSQVFIRSIRCWNRLAPAIDISNQASASAVAADQASTGPWNNQESLVLDAPDLTIINLGLNDAAGGTSSSAYVASVDAIVTKAKLSGDVLLVSPHPANPNGFAATANQIGLRDALSAYAASHNIAYMDLFSYFGSWDAISARSADGLVHLHRDAYAEIGEVYRQAIQLMAA